MAQEIGESREAWGRDVMALAEDFASHMKHEEKPFYIVYACKMDPHETKRLGRTAFKQTLKAYFEKPPALLGILVWYVDHRKGIFRFEADCSAPYDIPVDPSLLSEKADDALTTVMEKGKAMNVLLS